MTGEGGDGMALGAGDGVAVGEVDGVAVGEGDGVTLGKGDGVVVGEGDGVTQGEAVARGEGDTGTGEMGAQATPTRKMVRAVRRKSTTCRPKGWREVPISSKIEYNGDHRRSPIRSLDDENVRPRLGPHRAGVAEG